MTRQIAGETLIVPVRGGVGDLNSIYTLNQPGTLIWSLLSSGNTLPEILSLVCREYEVSEEDAEKDVREFLDNLLEAGLIAPSLESGR